MKATKPEAVAHECDNADRDDADDDGADEGVMDATLNGAFDGLPLWLARLEEAVAKDVPDDYQMQIQYGMHTNTHPPDHTHAHRSL